MGITSPPIEVEESNRCWTPPPMRGWCGNCSEVYRDRLRRAIAARLDRRLSSRLDPSDVVQETMADAVRRLPDYLRDRPMPVLRLAVPTRIPTVAGPDSSGSRRIGGDVAGSAGKNRGERIPPARGGTDPRREESIDSPTWNSLRSRTSSSVSTPELQLLARPRDGTWRGRSPAPRLEHTIASPLRTRGGAWPGLSAAKMRHCRPTWSGSSPLLGGNGGQEPSTGSSATRRTENPLEAGPTNRSPSELLSCPDRIAPGRAEPGDRPR